MSERPILYRCDPEKNTECRKVSCCRSGGPCEATKKADCAAMDGNGQPIEYKVRGKTDGTD